MRFLVVIAYIRGASCYGYVFFLMTQDFLAYDLHVYQ